jgi:Ca2+/Na+ antiporter
MREFLIKYLHFIIAGILVIFSLTKFLLISVSLPAHFFVIEFLSYLFILILVVFLDRVYYSRIEKEKALKNEIESVKRIAESRESQLLMRIMKLESKEREAILFTTHKKKTLHHLFADTDKLLSIEKIMGVLLKNFSKTFEIIAGIAYQNDEKTQSFICCNTFAIDKAIEIAPFKSGEGFCGQAIKDKEVKIIKNIPPEYFEAASGLGSSKPQFLYILPVSTEEKIIGLFELATFKEIDIVKIWPDINEKMIVLLKDRKLY